MLHIISMTKPCQLKKKIITMYTMSQYFACYKNRLNFCATQVSFYACYETKVFC